MSKNMVLHYGMKLFWVVAGLVLLNTGLQQFGIDIFAMDLFQSTLSFLMMPMAYVAGIAGLVMLRKTLFPMGDYCVCCNSQSKCDCPKGCKIK